MTGARHAPMACGSLSGDELLASLSGVSAIVELPPSGSLPLVITPAIPGAADVCDWVTSVRAPLDTALRQAGGLLFRGFDTGTIEAFARLSDVFIDVHMDYTSSLPLAVVRRNLSLEDDVLPLEVSYGDGSPIDNETARRIRLALRAETVTFPWRRGDVLVLDNMLTAHGRRPFTGDRRVFVAMGNSHLDALGRAAPRLEVDKRV